MYTLHVRLKDQEYHKPGYKTQEAAMNHVVKLYNGKCRAVLTHKGKAWDLMVMPRGGLKWMKRKPTITLFA